MKPVIYAGRNLKEFSRGERFAAFILPDGTAALGKAVVDATRADLFPKCYFQGGGKFPRADQVSAWCLLGDRGLGPDEAWPIWQPASVLPQKGDRIVYWDTELSRKNYSGPYWHQGEFGTENYRYQGASGPFVSGDPWSAVKSWVKLDDLIAWLGLADAPWLKVDARSEVRAFTKALYEGGVKLKCGDYVVDDHYEFYGFTFLSSEEQALGFINDLIANGCKKGKSAKYYFDESIESGTLAGIGMSRLTIAVHSLARARRTHCRCHETGSFAPREAFVGHAVTN